MFNKKIFFIGACLLFLFFAYHKDNKKVEYFIYFKGGLKKKLNHEKVICVILLDCFSDICLKKIKPIEKFLISKEVSYVFVVRNGFENLSESVLKKEGIKLNLRTIQPSLFRDNYEYPILIIFKKGEIKYNSSDYTSNFWKDESQIKKIDSLVN